MTPREAIPRSWSARLTGGAIALGQDLATTENKTSNPSALAVMERVGGIAITRLLVSWKTADPVITRQVIDCVLSDIEAVQFKPRRLVIDNSNEKFFSTQLKTEFGRRCSIELVGGNNKIEFRGETLDAKTLLGNMYVSAMEDGLILLPSGDWIVLDQRLVMRDKGGFTTLLGPGGEHGDTFDACKLGFWGLNSNAGPVRADAIQVGDYGMGNGGGRNHLGPRIGESFYRNLNSGGHLT